MLLSWLREEWQIINKMNECRLSKMLILLLSPFRDKPGLCHGCSRMLPPEHWFRLAPLSHVFPCSYPCPVFHPVSNENFSRVFGFNFPPVLSIHISLFHQHYPPWLLELSVRLGGWKVPQYSSAKTGAERGSSPAAGVLRTTGDAWNCLPIEPSVHCPHGDCCSINHILGCIRFTLEQNNGS